LFPSPLAGAPHPPGTLTHPQSPNLMCLVAHELTKAKWILKGGGVTSIYSWRTPFIFSHSPLVKYAFPFLWLKAAYAPGFFPFVMQRFFTAEALLHSHYISYCIR
jgi:hypothetical protein